MPKREIKTTGDLRRMLVDLLDKVEHKEIDMNQARLMANIASQINNSFYAEAKIAIVHWQLEGNYHPIGDTPLEGAIEAPQLEDSKKKQGT
jgi:hypothetical protein